MSSFARSTEPRFAGEGGIEAHRRLDEDPYRALDDLMTAVEALCPVWPQRDAFPAGGGMLL